MRDRLRRLPGGNALVRALVFLLGLFFVLLGLALSVLPGPLTIPFVLLGLVVWAAEFTWAEKLVERAKGRARDSWESAKAHPWRAGLVTGGGIALLVVALVLAARYELVDHARNALGV